MHPLIAKTEIMQECAPGFVKIANRISGGHSNVACTPDQPLVTHHSNAQHGICLSCNLLHNT
jgi:hypothetical protein